MLLDVHCHIDAYPQPAQALTAGGAAGVRTIAVTTSLVSYVRTRLLCQQHPDVQVALGLHPRRAGGGYEQWPEWKQMLDGVPVVGEVGLDFSQGSQEEWAAQVRTLAEICRLCAEGNRLVMLHASHAEAEAWETVSAQHLRWVVWHGYRPEAPRLPLYRAVEAGHLVAVGPDMAQSGSLQSRLRAIPREQVLTETDGPWGRLGAGDRAEALRGILGSLAEAWRCTAAEAEAQVERNWSRVAAELGMKVVTPVRER